MDFVCKIVIIESKQKTMKRPRIEENRAEVRSVKKCLFGKADADDTKKMLEEQIEADKSRLLDRFGFMVEDFEDSESCDIENVANNKQVKNGSSAFEIVGKKFSKAKRKVLQSRNQSFITDFFKNRKNVQCLMEKKSDTENDS